MLKTVISDFDRRIMAWHRSNETSKRLDETFRSARNFSAWVGLVPKQHSTGGKDKLGSFSKQGDRSLFTAGAFAVIRYAKIHGHQP